MSSAFLKTLSNVRIGELLVHSGALTQAQFNEANRHAGAKRLQIGQILVMYGYVSARDLQAALDAQSMIRDKSIDPNQALKCLKICYKTGVRFADIARDEQVDLGPGLPSTKLGELLLEARIITKEQFSHAIERSLNSGVPLGRMLVLEKLLPEEAFNSILDIQIRLRDEMISREAALEALRVACGIKANPTEEESQSQEDLTPPPIPTDLPRKKGIRVGELLVLSGILSETDVMNALEFGLTTKTPIGEVLVSQNLATNDLIEASLSLQKQVNAGSLTAAQAAECLSRVRDSGLSVEITLEELAKEGWYNQSPLTFQKMLTLARVVTHEEIETACDLSTKSAQIIGKVLLMTGYVTEETLKATLRCYQLLARGYISQDNAVASLDYCLHQRTDKPIRFDDALKELGLAALEKLRQKEQIASHFRLPAVPPDAPDVPDTHNAQEQTQPAIQQDNSHGANSSAETKAPERKKFSDTIAPEDPRAKGLSGLNLKALKTGDTVASTSEALLSTFARLADSYCEQGNYKEAQNLYERMLVLRLKEYGPNHPSLVDELSKLVGVLCTQGSFDQAEPFLRRAISILECLEEQQPLRLADELQILAGIYYRQGKYPECEPLFQRALELRVEFSSPDSMETADTLVDYAKLLRKLGNIEEAEDMYQRGRAMMAHRASYAHEPTEKSD